MSLFISFFTGFIIILASFTEFVKVDNILDDEIVKYVIKKYGVPSFILPPNLLNSSHIPTSDEDEAILAAEWLSLANEATRRLQHVAALLDWEYHTDLSEENARRLLDYGVWRKAYSKPWRNQAHLFREERLPSRLRRQLHIMKRGSSEMLEEKSREMLELHHEMQRMYSAGKVCVKNGTCYFGEPDLALLMETSRSAEELLWAWTSWRDEVGPDMRQIYFRFINLQNEMARSAGFHDMGEAWRREFGDEDFEGMCDGLYERIRPLYQQLHAYVRWKLREFYGEQHVNVTGPIPAHLLGNMWAQDWSNLMDIVSPYPEYPLPDVTLRMNSLNFTPVTMFRLAEDFFLSLGLEPMTSDFWRKSVFTKPSDGRDITCHASATNFYDGNDYRIRMCSRVSMDYLKTIHHEMGHVEYFMQYRKQPTVFQEGANSAFHEAIGDTVQYSFLTPQHLNHIGLLANLPSTPEEDINFLMKQALTKIPLLAFSLMLDKWRWKMLRDETDGVRWANRRWWKMREKYQGVKSGVKRDESDFDPGAKFHIPDNTPFIRYFIGGFIQVQFHQALCRSQYDSLDQIPLLHRCSIYGSNRAGDLLKSVLSLGSSLPWRETMLLMTGQKEITADAILEYYQPLLKWLTITNTKHEQTIGW